MIKVSKIDLFPRNKIYLCISCMIISNSVCMYKF